jgi:hypothetical protein
MSFAYVDFSWSQYSVAVLAERLQCCTLPAATSTAAISFASNGWKADQVRSKVSLRFAGAQARNAPIADSVAVSHGKLRAAGRAIIRATTSAQLGKYLNRT